MKRVVVITGAGSGIGKETAGLFSTGGDIVVNISLNVETNEDSNIYNCDVSVEEEVESVFQKIYNKFGHIDVLINNAGFGVSGAVELIPTTNINSIYNVNVLGVIYCSKHALKYMKPGAKIINIGSAMAFFPLPFRSIYASTKAAVVTLSYGMRMELNNFGVSVCVICPGDVKTNFTKNRVKDFQTNEKYGDRIKNAAGSLDEKENKRMSPIIVANAIFKQANKKKTKHMVIVGFKYKVLYVLQKLLPAKWVLAVTEKSFGGF